jgi:hypothetical protein
MCFDKQKEKRLSSSTTNEIRIDVQFQYTKIFLCQVVSKDNVGSTKLSSTSKRWKASGIFLFKMFCLVNMVLLKKKEKTMSIIILKKKKNFFMF